MQLIETYNAGSHLIQTKTIRVLFVCLGNICRSPMAEAVFAHLVHEAGLEEVIETDSAGIGSWHIGEAPHPGTRHILEKNGLVYRSAARQLTRRDLDDFDYIVTMDDQNLRDVRFLHGHGRAKTAPLLAFAAQLDVREVPDPYYSGDFGGVYTLVRAGAEGLLEVIRREHGL